MNHDGKFGKYGGIYVPELLMPAIEELEEALNGKLIIGDKHYSVDDYIKILSSLFYNKYLNSKKNMGAHK